jgi:hypothetical protein
MNELNLDPTKITDLDPAVVAASWQNVIETPKIDPATLPEFIQGSSKDWASEKAINAAEKAVEILLDF